MSLCCSGEGSGGRAGGGIGGRTSFFNGIFKDGFKLEVISMFTFERGKSKSCVLARGFAGVRACVGTRGLASITESCKHLSRPTFKGSAYQLDK